MNEPPAPEAVDPSEEIGALVQNLHTTHRRLQELTVGKVDAVMHPGGHAYLLHKAQEKLRLSEAVQRQLAETMSDILNALPAHIALLNASGVIVSVNDIWRQFATANELQGPDFSVKQNYLEICDRVTGECSTMARQVAAGIREVLAGTTGQFSLEYPCHSPTEQRWFLLLVTPVRKDRPAGAVVMHIDITERKRAEEAVRESEARFRSMFTAAATGIAVSTPEGRFLEVNAAYCGMLGYTEDEMRELNFAALTHPDDLTLNLKLRDEVLAGQRDSFVMEKRYIKKSGEVVWTRHSVSASRTAEGKIAKFVVVAEDITKKKLAEMQLVWKTAFFEAQVHSATDGILIVDTEGKTILQNQKLIDLWNISGAFELGTIKPQRMELLASQVKNSEQFTDRVEWLYEHPDEISRDEIELINGKILDRFSKPVWGQDGKYYGRIWSFHDVTESKKAQEALERRRSEMQVLFDLMPAMIWFKDTQNNILRVNQRAADATGLPVAELEGKSMYEIYPNEAEKYYADDLEVIRTGLTKMGIVEKFRSQDGKEIWIQTDKVPVCDKEGRAIGVVVLTQDITERKLAETNAAKQVELIHMASRVGKLGAWAIEFPGPKIIWSDEVYRIHEVEPDFKPDLATALDFFPPGSREKLETAVLERKPYDLELDFVTAKGKKLWVRTTSMAETIDGEVRLYGIFQDITERKRTEERFRRLVDSNAQGVFFWNTKGEITDGNDAFLQLVRYTREDLEAGCINWAKMTPPEFAHHDRDALDELAATGVCASYEKEFILKDGSRVPILLGAAMFEDNLNEGVCFVLDLTERKKLEQQFLRAQRMESIGTLAGGIAHDLNNVLAPITMSIDLLKMKFTDKSSQELLATLSSSAQRGAEMVRQVLSFARGVEGRKMDVQVKHLLKDIEKIANDTFPKNIQVRSIIPNELWTILGDPTQLHQVLLNFSVNARDAMPNGGTLTISAENIHLDEHYAGLNPDAHAGSYVFLQITDTGTGMQPGVIEKIFDPFFTTKEIGKGTGLGLSTSLAIVKSHGGFIRVYSEIGKGTTFKAYFPAQTEPSAQTAEETAAELPRGNGELILVVDDEASVRQITRQTLEAFGYRVALASDGAEAVAMVARQGAEIGVVLTDMMMPVMDGPATIQVLLRLHPDLPIIAASGLSADGRVTQAAGLGVKHFLSKPYSADALLQVLRQILSAK